MMCKNNDVGCPRDNCLFRHTVPHAPSAFGSPNTVTIFDLGRESARSLEDMFEKRIQEHYRLMGATTGRIDALPGGRHWTYCGSEQPSQYRCAPDEEVMSLETDRTKAVDIAFSMRRDSAREADVLNFFSACAAGYIGEDEVAWKKALRTQLRVFGVPGSEMQRPDASMRHVMNPAFRASVAWDADPTPTPKSAIVMSVSVPWALGSDSVKWEALARQVVDFIRALAPGAEAREGAFKYLRDQAQIGFSFTEQLVTLQRRLSFADFDDLCKGDPLGAEGGGDVVVNTIHAMQMQVQRIERLLDVVEWALCVFHSGQRVTSSPSSSPICPYDFSNGTFLASTDTFSVVNPGLEMIPSGPQLGVRMHYFSLCRLGECFIESWKRCYNLAASTECSHTRAVLVGGFAFTDRQKQLLREVLTG